jgi:vacuolar-type H+-ATPase subunit E/Vma4
VADEARRAEESLLAEARERAETRRAEAEQRAQEILAAAEAQGRVEGEREARRRLAQAEIAARQELLVARAGCVEAALEEATRRLAARADGPEGPALLAGLLQGAAALLGEPKLRLRLRTADRERLGGVAPDPEWVLDETPLDEPGAVVTTLDGRRAVDARLSALRGRRADAARRAAAAALFGPEPAR